MKRGLKVKDSVVGCVERDCRYEAEVVLCLTSVHLSDQSQSAMLTQHFLTASSCWQDSLHCELHHTCKSHILTPGPSSLH